jgi:acetyl-CoA synthetase
MQDKQLSLEQLVEAGLDTSAAGKILVQVNELLSTLPPAQCWDEITNKILIPDNPVGLHSLLYHTVYADWDPKQGPPPAWSPSKEYIQKTNIGGLMEELGLASYRELHTWSVENRTSFWNLMVEKLGIEFKEQYTKVMDLSNGVEHPQWFADGKLNIADTCFDLSCKAPAIVYQEEGSTIQEMSRSELDLLSNRVANGLTEAGFVPGDAVAIDMPMDAESVIIYLGIAKAGCKVISIADSFAPEEIEKRLRLGNAKGIFTQDHILRGGKKIPLYERVAAAHAPKTIILACDRNCPDPVDLREQDMKWEDFLSDTDTFESVPRDPSDICNILFSSGTTGDPKAIPWSHTTPVKGAADGYIHHDIRPNDVIAWPTNLGWMMGPWLARTRTKPCTCLAGKGLR